MKMISNLNILRLLLLMAALGWGGTVIGVFIPWDFAVEHLILFGGVEYIPDDPMLNYWLRMAAGAFGMIGMLFFVCAWKPKKYAAIIPLLALLNLGEGVVLLYYGLLLDLSFFPFVIDVSLGLVPGIGVLLLRGSLQED